MIKFIILMMLVLNVNAAERKAPMPDAAERGEMECFDVSQAFHKVLTNIQAGGDADMIISGIKLNGKNAIKNSKLTGSNYARLVSDINRVSKQAIDLVNLSKRIGHTATPSDVQIWYFDYCVIAFNKELKRQNALTGK